MVAQGKKVGRSGELLSVRIMLITKFAVLFET
jgi:hypothetical protein